MFEDLKKNIEVRFVDFLTSQLKDVRKQLLTEASGHVVDIGIGGGNSLPLYPSTISSVTGVEPEPSEKFLMKRAKKIAGQFDFKIKAASAHELPFEDDSIDTVTFQLVLCTIPDPAKAIAEARRVLKPEGKVLFLEHLRHTDKKVARFQDRFNPTWSKYMGGCRLNQDTPKLFEEGGFDYTWRESVIDKQPPRFLSHITWGVAQKI